MKDSRTEVRILHGVLRVSHRREGSTGCDRGGPDGLSRADGDPTPGLESRSSEVEILGDRSPRLGLHLVDDRVDADVTVWTQVLLQAKGLEHGLYVQRLDLLWTLPGEEADE
jgi:hypothetical protein